MHRGLDSVMKLRPVTFHWKDKNMDHGQRIGFIAQEVERLYPEAVGTDTNDMKRLAYSNLVVPLVKAVQEQQAEISVLSDQVRRQQQQIEKLKRRIGQLAPTLH